MKRYAQQVKLPEIGIVGQEKIQNSAVLIVGAGGLGTVVATYLASMGFGKILIVDFDSVDETNLHRQFLYTEFDIGEKKANVLAKKLNVQNSQIQIIPIVERITDENFSHIISNSSIVCDCSDNLATRFLLDMQCHQFKIPLVHGAASTWEGYITLFHYKKQFQYKDLFGIKTLLQADSCENIGISSPICGIVGSTMANEVLKIVLDLESNLDGGILYINGLQNVFKVLKLKKSNI
uniref:HesA/MoeB/ThiF family protein n=1 Tax=Flavobacterium sp. TaxID=239 RepID=UPI00404B7E8A